MVQMYLHENTLFWKLLDGDEFMCLRNVVDNTMKERHAMGLGIKQSSEVISLAHEDIMFRNGILGDENPIQLLQTVIYMVGLHCAFKQYRNGDIDGTYKILKISFHFSRLYLFLMQADLIQCYWMGYTMIIITIIFIIFDFIIYLLLIAGQNGQNGQQNH